MHNRWMFRDKIASMPWMISLMAVLPSVAAGQVARTELHPIESVTVTNQQFLRGDKNGKRVVIAGELQLPRGRAVSQRSCWFMDRGAWEHERTGGLKS